MSSSSAGGPQALRGRVILPHNTPGPKVVSVQDLEGPLSRQAGSFCESDARVYLARVRDRATEKAREVIAQALAEAETIRQAAFAEGHEAGVAQGMAEVAAQREELGRRMEALLEALRSQGRELLRHQGADLVQLVRLAVERTLACELSEKRGQVLEGLLAQALDIIDSQRRLTIKVHPDDRPLLESIVAQLRQTRPNLGDWRLVDAPDIAHGGLVLESDEGLVDNTLATRFAEVDAVLNQLSLVAGQVAP